MQFAGCKLVQEEYKRQQRVSCRICVLSGGGGDKTQRGHCSLLRNVSPKYIPCTMTYSDPLVSTITDMAADKNKQFPRKSAKCGADCPTYLVKCLV